MPYLKATPWIYQTQEQESKCWNLFAHVLDWPPAEVKRMINNLDDNPHYVARPAGVLRVWSRLPKPSTAYRVAVGRAEWGNDVPQSVNNETIGIAEMLASELRAIDYWDIIYWRKRCRENYETAAYQSRQRRRAEIVRQLTKLYKPDSIFARSVTGGSKWHQPTR